MGLFAGYLGIRRGVFRLGGPPEDIECFSCAGELCDGLEGGDAVSAGGQTFHRRCAERLKLEIDEAT